MQKTLAYSGTIWYDAHREVKTMEKKGLSQEGLKLIACITMLIDHIGAVFFPSVMILRIIGRLSFPIYCFLLAEGAAYTRHAGRYALRLLICALVSELPHDLAFYGRLTLGSLSVMANLLIGFGMLWAIGKTSKWWLKAVCIGIAMVLARILDANYDYYGILVIAAFGLTRGKTFGWAVQAAAMAVLFWVMPSAKVPLGSFRLPVQFFGVLALIPIMLYSGRKITGNKCVQWGFYLFYPLHLLVLYLIKLI